MSNMNKQRSLNKRIAVLDIHSPLYLRSERSLKPAGCIEDLYTAIDQASDTGFSAIQMLPIQDTGLLSSPYMGRSIFSYNPVFYATKQRSLKGGAAIDYRDAYKLRMRALVKDAEGVDINLSQFTRNEVAYALFSYFHKNYQGRWPKWPATIRHGRIEEILNRYPHLINPIKKILAEQKILSDQWQNVWQYARRKKIDFILDKPIYPIHNSAEVWSNQHLFYLNPDGTLKFASGCDNPRDPFGAQYWGHAVYQFKEKADEVIDYFVEQIRFLSKYSKYIRLDHTLALIWKYYLIDPDTRTGHHVKAIRHKLFNRLIAEFPEVYFIAEDLGYVSQKEVDAHLIQHAVPGMRCMQWFHIPKYAAVNRYPHLCYAMTSNHDLDSLPNWWRHLRSNRKKIFTRQFDGSSPSTFDEEIDELIKLVFESQAAIASVTLRDLGHDLRRYNHPSYKNPTDWRLRMGVEIEKMDFSKMKKIILESNRSNP